MKPTAVGIEDGITYHHLKPGDILFREGDNSLSLFVLKEGELVVYQERNGKKRTLGQVLEHQLVGEMAFVDNAPRSATVEAVKPSIVIELDSAAFKKYFQTQPFWLKALINNLIGYIRQGNQNFFE